ncbi:hypothetical protein CK203_005089 [Vitis vinifera]|uniref:Uncharacterized protein n=1 Tax=Vitis vinifera TaxID=29760 RepID=A0A438KEN5_VITVI|nr:hypothetical protein CK203_005089 [Vitis vinifera]
MPSLTPLKRSPLSIHRLHVRLFSQPVDSPPSSLTLFEISHSNHPKNPNFTYFLKWVSGITFVGSGLGYFYYSDSAFDSLKNSFSSFAEWSKATKESMTGKNPKFLFGGDLRVRNLARNVHLSPLILYPGFLLKHDAYFVDNHATSFFELLSSLEPWYIHCSWDFKDTRVSHFLLGGDCPGLDSLSKCKP